MGLLRGRVENGPNSRPIYWGKERDRSQANQKSLWIQISNLNSQNMMNKENNCFLSQYVGDLALPAFHAIIRLHRALLTEHPVDFSLPQDLQELSGSILSEMGSQKQHCRPLICEQSKPVPLKLVTPWLVKVLDFGRKQDGTKEEQGRKRRIRQTQAGI